MRKSELCRTVIVLDLNSVELTLSEIRAFSDETDRIVQQWLGDEVRLVRRVYAPEQNRRVAWRLGRRHGWRQGGNGKAADIASHIWNDAKAFCLHHPSSSALVLFSADPSLKGLINDLRRHSVQVFLVCKPGAV